MAAGAAAGPGPEGGEGCAAAWPGWNWSSLRRIVSSFCSSGVGEGAPLPALPDDPGAPVVEQRHSPRTTWHLHDAAVRWPASWAPMAAARAPSWQRAPAASRRSPARSRDRGVGHDAGSPALSPGVPRLGAGASPRFGAVWAGRRAPQAPLRQARSASGSDATGSLRSRTTAVLRACRARLARPRATAPEARRRHRAGEHLGQQEPVQWPTPQSRPHAASVAR